MKEQGDELLEEGLEGGSGEDGFVSRPRRNVLVAKKYKLHLGMRPLKGGLLAPFPQHCWLIPKRHCHQIASVSGMPESDYWLQ